MCVGRGVLPALVAAFFKEEEEYLEVERGGVARESRLLGKCPRVSFPLLLTYATFRFSAPSHTTHTIIPAPLSSLRRTERPLHASARGAWGGRGRGGETRGDRSWDREKRC